MRMVKLDRKVIRVILEFQVSWGPQGILGHQERMELQELPDHQEFKGHRGKKVLLAPKAHLESLEFQEKKANRAETENQVPLGCRAKWESQVCQVWREQEAHLASRDTQVTLALLVPGENLVPRDPLARKEHQEKMVTLDLQGHRVPEDQGAHRVTMDPQAPQETQAIQEPPARREAKEKMAPQDFLASWVLVGLPEKQERKACRARRVHLESPESQEPKEKGETLESKATKDCLVGRVSLGTLESQATRATQV